MFWVRACDERGNGLLAFFRAINKGMSVAKCLSS